MKVKKSPIPPDSITGNFLPADYWDVYTCKCNFEKEMTPDDFMVGFWTNFPNWVKALFKLRNFLVKFVGLKSDESSPEKLERCIRTGEAYGFVSVPAKSENETVLLLTDKHLDAYISVYVESEEVHKTISAITLVNFKNKLGRIYFFIIRPFHSLIVKSLLKRTAKLVV